MNNTLFSKQKKTGFTLVELLVVVLVLAVLAAIAVSVIPAAARKAKEAALRTTLSEIQSAVDRFYAENNRWPVGESQFEGEAFAVAISWTDADALGRPFVGHYLRFEPTANPTNYGMDIDDGDTVYFGITETGLVFATQTAPDSM